MNLNATRKLTNRIMSIIVTVIGLIIIVFDLRAAKT